MTQVDSTGSSSSGAPLARLLRYARPFRARMWVATLWSILNKVFDLAPPFIIGAAIDVVVRGDDSFLASFGVPDRMTQIWILGGITVVIWVLESVFEWLLGVAWRGLAQDMQHAVRLDVFAHVQTLELRYFEDRSTGGLMSILSEDVNQLERFLDGGANDIIQLATTTVCVVAAFFWISPSIAWLAMMPVPFVILGSLWFQRLLGPRYDEVRAAAGDLNAQLANNLGGIATIKSFTAERAEVARLAEESTRYADRNRGAILLSSGFSPLIRMVIAVGFVVTLVYGGHLVIEGSLQVAAFSLLVFLTQRLLWPFTRVGAVLDLYQRAMASTKRLLDLLDAKPAIVDGARSLDLDSVRGEIAFEDVHFGYLPTLPVLDGVTMEMPAGSTTGIVGATGAGKSTIIKLILRFYEAHPEQRRDAGRVTLDGIDLRDLKLRDLRRAIGLVSQDVYLFHGTVRENIAYGWAEIEGTGMSDDGDGAATPVPFDRIVAAAKLAEAHDFITGLADGYDTIVGERGQKLSGGQRQRIAMARAILKDAPILILDEATASVDNETEAAIQRALETITADRTTIMIAHRLSTIRHADQIFVLDRGRVAERGTHEELLARDGLYANLWRVQTGEVVVP